MARFDLVDEVRRSIMDETGERCSRAFAAVQVDRMCDAFVQRWEGAGPAYAVVQSPDVARYLSTRWKGEEGKTLRATIAAFERGDIARLAVAEGWGAEPEPEVVCDWLVEVADGAIVECGAKVGPHPQYPGVEAATLCENGHDRLPCEIELAPFGPAWQREQEEERYGW